VSDRRVRGKSKWQLSLVWAGSLVWVMGFSPVVQAYDSFGILHDDPRLSPRLLAIGSMLGMAEDVEGVFGNPAGLGTLALSDLELSAGAFSDQGLGGTVAYAQPLPSLGKIGFGVSELQPPNVAAGGKVPLDIPAREQMLAVAYCQPVFSLLDLGVRYRALELEQPGFTPVSCETVDLGVRVHPAEDYWLSLGTYNLFQPVAGIPGSATVGDPRFGQVTLGARWEGVCKAAAEYTQTLDGSNLSRVAGGLESDFSRHWFVRAGINGRRHFDVFDRLGCHALSISGFGLVNRAM